MHVGHGKKKDFISGEKRHGQGKGPPSGEKKPGWVLRGQNVPFWCGGLRVGVLTQGRATGEKGFKKNPDYGEQRLKEKRGGGTDREPYLVRFKAVKKRGGWGRKKGQKFLN